MPAKRKYGFIALAKKSLAVISASLSALSGAEAKIAPIDINPAKNDADELKNLRVKPLKKPKLVLKLNITDPANSITAMHTSHSSHRSHSSHHSHSSHYSGSPSSSHSSHYSSAPSFTPPASSPSSANKKSGAAPSGSSGSSGVKKQNSTGFYATPDSLQYFEPGSRVLYRGCKGSDVTYLQKLLDKLGYITETSGYFGEATEYAVKSFQKKYSLKIDGRVDKQTLLLIKSK